MIMKSSRNIPGLLVANKAKQKAGAKTGRYDSLKGANEDRYQSFADAGWSRPDAGGSGPEGRKRMDFVPPKPKLEKIDSYKPSVFKRKYTDSEALDDLATDEASEMQFGLDRSGSSSPNIFKQKYTDSEAMEGLLTDEASEMQFGLDKIDPSKSAIHKREYTDKKFIGPDSEALEESAMDEASEMQMLADVNAVPQGEGDERFMKEFDRKLDQYKREQIGSLGEAEGRLAADAYQQIPMSQSYLNQLGPKVDTEESALDKIGEQEKRNRFAQEKRDRFQDSMPEQEEQSMLSKFGDSVSNFFGDDDEEKAKNYKAMASAYKGANTPSPQQGGNTSMQNARTVAGKVAFPGLLNKPKRQKTPYFMPKGLV